MLMGTGAVVGGASAANELGAFKPSLKGFKPTYWTPENVDTLKAVIGKYEGQPGRLKNTMNEFRRRQEELGRPYTQSDSALQTMIARTKSWGGLNKETGVGTTNVGPEPYGAKANSSKFQWTPEAENHLLGLHQNYPKGMMGRDRVIAEEFSKQYPDWVGRSSDLTKKLNKFEDSSGGTTLGSNFGNASKNQDLINWLQEQQPVGTAEIKALAQNMGLQTNVRVANSSKPGKEATYLNLKDPANPDNRATVRFPGPKDKIRHHADERLGSDPKSTLFDTGYGYPPEMQPMNPNLRPLNPSNVITAGGESYAKPGVLNEALRAHFFGKAPGGDLRLVSPEYARFPKEPTPQTGIYGPQLPENWSPDQLKLLSGGQPTTADIIKILQQQGKQGIYGGQET
jgi:hypothetical protein